MTYLCIGCSTYMNELPQNEGGASWEAAGGIWDLGLEHRSQNPALQNSPSSIPCKVCISTQNALGCTVGSKRRNNWSCFHFAAVEQLNKSCVVQCLPPWTSESELMQQEELNHGIEWKEKTVGRGNFVPLEGAEENKVGGKGEFPC